MFVLIFLIWVLFAVLGFQLGKERTIGAGGGLALCLVLGLIGVIIVLCLPKVNNDWQANYDADAQIAQSYSDLYAANHKSANAADDLKKWHELRASGAITDEEFEKKKKEILG